MKTEKTFCRRCGNKVVFTITGPVVQKPDMYHVICEKGHISEMFISKNLIKALKKEQTVDNSQ